MITTSLCISDFQLDSNAFKLSSPRCSGLPIWDFQQASTQHSMRCSQARTYTDLYWMKIKRTELFLLITSWSSSSSDERRRQGSNLTCDPSLHVILPLSHPFSCLPTAVLLIYSREKAICAPISIWQSISIHDRSSVNFEPIWKMMIVKRLRTKGAFSYQSLLVKSIPSRMFSSVSCRPLVYTTTMYRTRSDHALSSRTAWTGWRQFYF